MYNWIGPVFLLRYLSMNYLFPAGRRWEKMIEQFCYRKTAVEKNVATLD